MNLSAFKKIVFAATQQMGGTVADLYEPQVTPNFFAARICMQDTQFYVLCSDNDVWAFSQMLRPFQLEFIDHSAMAAALANLGVVALTTAQLNAPFVKQPGMSDRDINYWKPETMGDGLFNWWD